MKFINCNADKAKVFKNSKNLTLSWGIPVNPMMIEKRGLFIK